MAMPSAPGPWIRPGSGPRKGARPARPACPARPGPRIRSRRGYALAAALTATALAGTAPAAGALPAAAHRGSTDKPTIVLVHGAFADASSWREVVPRLQNDGYRVMAPANPLRGLHGDAAYIASVLRSIKGPIVLVGHSYAGAVISGAAVGNAQVKALVYINALMPDKGEVLSVLSAKFPGSELTPALKSVPFTLPDGSTATDLYIKADRFRPVFAASLPAATTAVLAASQRPIAAQAFADTAGPAAWRTIPSWAMVSTADKTISPELERFEAERAHSHTVEIDAPHLAMLTHPKAVTDLILAAARLQPSLRPATKDPARTLAATGSTGATGPGGPAGPTGSADSPRPGTAGLAGAALMAGAALVAATRKHRPTAG
ncbi:alpha/beta fold hydrolase [Streptomyces sp. NPDC059396]|uniref:alpha/beta fold hydrolase n=1 Tax=Streptomyces sp. NPDC059396 TaxID=3346819 RepID=UPI00369BEC5C